MKLSKKAKRRIAPPISAKTDVVAQDTEADLHSLDLAALADEREGIRQGLEDIKNGRTRPAREVLEAFRRSRGIPL
jgi:predicted transcriptional regulator